MNLSSLPNESLDPRANLRLTSGLKANDGHVLANVPDVLVTRAISTHRQAQNQTIHCLYMILIPA